MKKRRKKLLCILLVTILGLTVLSGCQPPVPAEPLKEPPELTVKCGEQSIQVHNGADSWSDGNVNSSGSTIHPLYDRDNYPSLATNYSEASFGFSVEPSRIVEIRRWDYHALMADPDTDHSSEQLSGAPVKFSENTFQVGFGDYIYEILAEWPEGTASYVFVINTATPGSLTSDVLTSPPDLTVKCGENAIEANITSCSWYYNDGGTEASSLHPLYERDNYPLLTADESRVTLEFDVPPLRISEVRCWDYHTPYADPDTDYSYEQLKGEPVEFTETTVNVRSGEYIYAVEADWAGEDYHGNASYIFRIKSDRGE